MGKNDSLGLARQSRKLTVDWFREITVPGALAGTSSVRTDVHVETVQDTFCTGSSYKGQVDSFGFAGIGTYVYPHGAVYEGYFRDGQFHGDGTITYPNGDYVEGLWLKGKLVKRSFNFADGLKYDKPWHYCEYPDRRFQDEETTQVLDNLLPRHCQSKIPPDCYFTGDGYYRPDVGLVCDKNHRALRVVTEAEEKKIKENYRKEADDHVELMKQFYEHWTSGRAKDVLEIAESAEEETEQRRACSLDEDESQSAFSLSFLCSRSTQ